ncbi:MAG: hypothetical protein QOG09_400 [Solirubrobacterales bacterium]|jgi:hypothetical protein|nr:hypothetical protein [Solirubrobacterales bacterium]MDX6651356.1 hypothetical protein [Solirubrobacterales bacterium]MDX6662298.1 hypothetical protein [Solirubrobacterales bacterium]
MEARTATAHEISAAARREALLRYDRERRRLWVNGQRLHHGLTGVLLAAVGGALMVHDWKDRRAWFQRGPQF